MEVKYSFTLQDTKDDLSKLKTIRKSEYMYCVICMCISMIVGAAITFLTHFNLDIIVLVAIIVIVINILFTVCIIQINSTISEINSIIEQKDIKSVYYKYKYSRVNGMLNLDEQVMKFVLFTQDNIFNIDINTTNEFHCININYADETYFMCIKLTICIINSNSYLSVYKDKFVIESR